MKNRKYKKCEWCDRTVDITNEDKDFCKQCQKYETYEEYLKSNPIITL